MLESIIVKFVVCWDYRSTRYWIAIEPLINV